MKTALDILFETTNGDADYISVNNCLDAMKIYAKQVAEQALKDAAENALINYYEDIDVSEIDLDSILSTPIKTP